jgi:hypothetical protein
MNMEHRIDVLALWGFGNELTKCRVLDYGPVQGTRWIRLTQHANGYRRGARLIADIRDIFERETR